MLRTSFPFDKIENDLRILIAKLFESLPVMGKVGNGLSSLQASNSVPINMRKARVEKIPLKENE